MKVHEVFAGNELLRRGCCIAMRRRGRGLLWVNCGCRQHAHGPVPARRLTLHKADHIHTPGPVVCRVPLSAVSMCLLDHLSSARASSAAGTVMPSALAVLRLIISSSWSRTPPRDRRAWPRYWPPPRVARPRSEFSVEKRLILFL